MVKKIIFPHELIGEIIEVINSKNKSNIGIKGEVIDETKKAMTVKLQDKIKILLKSNIVFKIQRTGQMIIGETITKRPEDRIKGK